MLTKTLHFVQKMYNQYWVIEFFHTFTLLLTSTVLKDFLNGTPILYILHSAKLCKYN